MQRTHFRTESNLTLEEGKETCGSEPNLAEFRSLPQGLYHQYLSYYILMLHWRIINREKGDRYINTDGKRSFSPEWCEN